MTTATQEATTLPVRFSITDAAIAEMETRYAPLTIKGLEDRAGFALVHEARMQVKNARCEVETTRKALKADALEWGRKVDAEAKRITARLLPIEERLQREEDVVLRERERIRQEKEAEKERQILAEQRRKDELLKSIDRQWGNAALARIGNPMLALSQVEDEVRQAEKAEMLDLAPIFQEFADTARADRLEFVRRGHLILADRVKREAEIEAQRQEQIRLDHEREQLRQEREALQREKAAQEAALKAEQDRLAEEKRKGEAVEAARRELIEQAERDRRIKAELDAQRTDAEKMHAYGQALLDVPRPTLGTANARRALEAATDLVRKGANLMLAAKAR